MRKKRAVSRVRWLHLLFLALFVTLLSRLVWVQVIEHAHYRELARIQQREQVQIAPDRGAILDRNGRPLAISQDCYSVFAVPRDIPDWTLAARRLAGPLGISSRTILRKFRSSPWYVWLKRKVPEGTRQAVESLGLAGIGLKKEKQRLYPRRELAAQVIGATGLDNEGLSGLEHQYDALLRGEPGWTVLQKDAFGRLLVSLEMPMARPVEGMTLVLTLDAALQEIAEDALRRAVEESGARAGCLVALDPWTGEVLALANDPGIDLNITQPDVREEHLARLANRAVTDCFEPGSTFKVITLAAALGEGATREGDRIYCEKGLFRLGRRTVRDVHKYEWLTVAEVFAHSSNIGVIKISEQVGRRALYRYARDFGFGTPTGIDYPGEAIGTLRRLEDWSGFSLASVAIGQEVSATALQMACAYAAVANGGCLLKPRLVREVRAPDGRAVGRSRRVEIRRVLDPVLAGRMRRLMVGVVEEGTGTKARLEGFPIAGKTGTAQKAAPQGGGFLPGKYVASFGGFAPADDPRIVLFVTLDEPQRSHFGGEVAAPAFREVVREALLAGIPPLEPGALASRHPRGEELARTSPASAERSVVRAVSAELEREDDVVAPAQSVAAAVVDGEDGRPGAVLLPDVRGLALRAAYRRLTALGFRVRVEGGGWVVDQVPPAGSLAGPGEEVVLTARWEEREGR